MAEAKLSWSERAIELRGAIRPGHERVLTEGALCFVSDLTQRFASEMRRLLAARADRRRSWAAGEPLGFLAETEEIRRSAWRVAALPADLQQRKVEITGPVERKMIINALNSGADTYMADFEDSTSPTWDNMVAGQLHLQDAVRRAIEFQDPSNGRLYRLVERQATLLVRPRGLHLEEGHCLVDGRPVPGALFDFGLFVYHNAHELCRRGSGPYLYLPKLESHLEARWWAAVFAHAESALGLEPGTIKATVLVETLPAAFEMHEILYELRRHSAGLNCGRWDYIFSFIKCRRWEREALLPDRSQVTMEQPCMRAYAALAVQTCHARGVHAIGGMAAQIPIKNDPAANRAALERVHADKRREVRDGHDGTWVAHPGLVPIARAVFDTWFEGPHQLEVMREDVRVGAADLLRVPQGTRTEAGLRLNLRVGVRYLAAWLGGSGCVPLYHLMEDAATAEISRTQVWQWLHHAAVLDDGRTVTPALVRDALVEERAVIAEEIGPERYAQGRYDRASELFAELCFAEELEEFLTRHAYHELTGLSD